VVDSTPKQKPVPPIAAPDCRTFPCHDECCFFGADVWPQERARIVRDGLGTEDEFTGPYDDTEGDTLYRTAVGTRGCVFLLPTRGCRLHVSGHKPEACIEFPVDAADADEMVAEDKLPCRHEWKWGT